MKVRLDKWLSANLNLSRKEVTRLIKNGQIQVDNGIMLDPAFKSDFSVSEILIDNQQFKAEEPVVIFLNKPVDYECSHNPTNNKSVYSLLPKKYQHSHNSVGRLDVNTSGLLIFTDDGDMLHKLTSPRKHCIKTYYVELNKHVSIEEQEYYITMCKNGFVLKGESKTTLPAKLVFDSDRTCTIQIVEGKYHQVRRMFAFLGNHVTCLSRTEYDVFTLKNLNLDVGQFKIVTKDEFMKKCTIF